MGAVLTGHTGPGVPNQAIQDGAPLEPAAAGPGMQGTSLSPILRPEGSQETRGFLGPALQPAMNSLPAV